MRTNKRRFTAIKIGLIVAAIPIIIHAYSSGPIPGVTGAPGDNKTGCIESGCHQGTPNSGPGSIKLLLPSGNNGTYTPGQTMQIMVQISDSTKQAFGFQLTSRSGSNGMTQAGDFSTTDANTQVICPDSSTKANGKTCPSQFPTEYIEHTEAGFMASLNKTTYTYSFNWTAPATNVGTVTMYFAGNAGTTADVVTPTNVYLSSMQLTPAASNAPSISSGGVAPINSHATTIQPTSWISIYGSNLATSTAFWNGDFPTTLGGTSVAINGKPGYLYYASPGQLNLQAPTDSATGTVPVVVTVGTGSSAQTVSSTVTLGQYGPSFSLLGDAASHAAGIILRSDGSGAYGGGTYDIVGPTGTSLGYKTVAAKAGDTLVLFGVGFGPTSPAVAAAAQPPSVGAPTTSTVSLLINNKSVTPSFSGLTSAGLFQFNLTVPSGLGTGDVPLSAIVGGVTTPTGVVLSIQ